jgi:hypothetical protein
MTNCQLHPDFPIGGQCAQCKASLCVRCAPNLAYASRPLCSRCAEGVKVEVTRDERTSLAVEIGALQLIIGGLIVASVLMVDKLSDSMRALAIAALAGPAIAGAVLTAITRRALVPTVTLGFVAVELSALFVWNVDAIVDGTEFAHMPLRITLLVMMAVPIYVVRRIQKLGQLQKQQRRQVAA